MAHRHVLMMLDAAANAFLDDPSVDADLRLVKRSRSASCVDARVEEQLALLEKELSLAMREKEFARLH